MSELAIEVSGLRKRYGSLEAVAGVELRVERGEVFALLGPNGAGKTTTVEILEGHRRASAGHVRVLGHDPSRHERALKERVGIVLQSTGVEPYLSVAETVELFRGYYPHPLALDEVLEVVGLREHRSTPVRRLSGGQLRRLDVAVGLAGDPELLFLDEPTTGFDPSARRDAWRAVENLRALGKTVFLTTHYMEEAEQLASRVAILTEGRIVALGAPRELMAHDRTSTIAFRAPAEAGPLPPGLEAQAVAEGMLAIRTQAPTEALHALTAWAVERGVELDELTVSRPSLEDVYLRLIAGGEPNGFSGDFVSREDPRA